LNVAAASLKHRVAYSCQLPHSRGNRFRTRQSGERGCHDAFGPSPLLCRVGRGWCEWRRAINCRCRTRYRCRTKGSCRQRRAALVHAAVQACLDRHFFCLCCREPVANTPSEQRGPKHQSSHCPQASAQSREFGGLAVRHGQIDFEDFAKERGGEASKIDGHEYGAPVSHG